MTQIRSTRSRRGFTAVEILVVMAILAVLIGIITPAINSARESAQRAKCSSNLMQIGHAVHNHENTFRRFPTGGWGTLWNGHADRPNNRQQPGGWAYNLLPFLDQKQTHLLGPAAVQTKLAIYNCPSRRRADTLHRQDPLVTYADLAPTPSEVARGDYAANLGWVIQNGAIDNTPKGGPANLAGEATYPWNPPAAFNGIIFERSEIDDGDIPRGRSNVYLVGEKTLDPDRYNDGQAPNDNQNLYSGYSFDACRGTAYATPAGTIVIAPQRDERNKGLGVIPTAGISGAGFGGPHRDGFNMLYCDMSVKVIRYDIDQQIHIDAGRRR